MSTCLNKTQDIQHLSTSQYSSVDKLLARWNLYAYSTPLIDIYKTGIERLQLKGDENIFEAGCGDGQVLLTLRKLGHRGDLVGLDINEGMFKDAIKSQSRDNLLPIDFIVGSADKLPFADKSFDLILAFFMLYHVPDIHRTLEEWRRTLKKNGKILIATASSDNKPKHKQFKKIIERVAGESIPPQLSEIFNLENAANYLNKHFTIIDRFVYRGKIKIENPSLYLYALDSIKDLFDPVPSSVEWHKARGIIKEKIQNEIDENGCYTDIVKRGFFICQVK